MEKNKGNMVESINLFKERMKKLYKLEETATNAFEKMVIKIMNENFRKQEKILIKLIENGQVKINQ
jgi:hypothetical protein